MITQQYILPRDVAWNRFSLANVLPKLSQDVYLGKGSGGSLDEVQMVKQKPNEEPSGSVKPTGSIDTDDEDPENFKRSL